MIIDQLAIGTALIMLTVIIHAFTLSLTFRSIDYICPKIYRLNRHFWITPMMILAVLGTIIGHSIEIWIWAIFYMEMDVFQALEPALYFSTSSFTTVGFGDIFLDEKWRLLSALQSANGFILFGWSTAFIFEIMTKLYKDKKIDKYEKA